MPKYIDHHAQMPPMPPEMVQQMAAGLKAGQVDQFGVKGLNFFMGADGQGWCLTEAPSADAVVKSHQALGFQQDHAHVTEVNSLV